MFRLFWPLLGSFFLPSFSLAHTTHTHCQQKVAVAAHHLHLDTLPVLPSRLPAGLAHWTILIGLSVVHGKSRPWRPGWYGMVWYPVWTEISIVCALFSQSRNLKLSVTLTL